MRFGRISNLFRIEDDVVFYANNLNDKRQYYYDGLRRGELTGYTIAGEPMDPDESSDKFLLMCDYWTPKSTLEEIYRNIELSPILVSMVRNELRLEAETNEYLSELSTVIGMIQVGLFNDASNLLIYMKEHSTIDPDRLDNWSKMLNSCDAVDKFTT